MKQPHPDANCPQDPALRLATIEAAGIASVPFTSGILIGIGETRLERIEALLQLRALHERHGHLQVCLPSHLRQVPCGYDIAWAASP